nr:T9SS type A sorting domain-containing protein [Flavobacterium sp.]
FNSTTGGSGTISNWLITPVLNLQNGDVITFYTRKGGDGTGTIYADRLELRLNSTDTSTGGNPSGATGVGAFTTLAVSVNPNLTTSGYPFTWTQYSYTVTGLTGVVPCRVGFRYFVTSAGPSGANSDIIGIDTFSVDRPLSSETFFKNNFSIYPNPVNNVLNVTMKNEININSVSITDLNGRVILLSNSSNTSIDVSNLSSGVYFVSIETNEGKGTSKFVKN